MTHREATALLDHPALHGLTDGASAATSLPQSAGPGLSPNGAPHPPLRWADLGCGSGTFTLALAEYLAPGSTIDAIDLHPTIRAQTTANNIHITPQFADFVTAGIEKLDGIIMANSLHYVADQPRMIQKLHAALRPGGLLVLVEYDTDIAVSRWHPSAAKDANELLPVARAKFYPVSFAKAARLFGATYWSPLQKIGQKRSAFGRSNLYSAFTTRLPE